MSIPTLDLSLAASPTTRPALIASLRHALLDIGFLYITNHSIPPPLTETLTSLLPQLFSLPPAQKSQSSLLNTPHFLGYSALSTETTASAPDHREQFEFANDLPNTYSTSNSDSQKPLYTRLYGPNQYPTHLPLLAPTIQSYITALHSLALSFLSLCNLALHLPPQSLESFVGVQNRLKLVHYPASPSGGQVQGVGPHKDSSGWLTFLLQASPESKGLQVLTKGGEWVDVPPKEGSLVVNLGQAFEAATGGRCRATTHRVVVGEGVGRTNGGSEVVKGVGDRMGRFSVPFFMGVRGDLTVGELKGLWELLDKEEDGGGGGNGGNGGQESEEGRSIDCPFLRGGWTCWGEAQLRTKCRSHRDVGEKWYADQMERFTRD